jgi:hypothetical protein
VGKLATAWAERKSELQGVGVQTSIFKQDLGSKLNAFDAAVINYDRVRQKMERSDPKLVPYVTAVRQASTTMLPVAVSYEETIHPLAMKATDTRQKVALERAEGWILNLIETVRQVQNKLPK